MGESRRHRHLLTPGQQSRDVPCPFSSCRSSACSTTTPGHRYRPKLWITPFSQSACLPNSSALLSPLRTSNLCKSTKQPLSGRMGIRKSLHKPWERNQHGPIDARIEVTSGCVSGGRWGREELLAPSGVTRKALVQDWTIPFCPRSPQKTWKVLTPWGWPGLRLTHGGPAWLGQPRLEIRYKIKAVCTRKPARSVPQRPWDIAEAGNFCPCFCVPLEASQNPLLSLPLRKRPGLADSRAYSSQESVWIREANCLRL